MERINRRKFLEEVVAGTVALVITINIRNGLIAEASVPSSASKNNQYELAPSQKLIEPVERDVALKPVEASFDREINLTELNSPGSISFEEASDRLALAKTVFAEAEGEWTHPDYMEYVASTVLRRSNITGWPIKDVLSFRTEKNFSYSFMNPKNPRNKYFHNPLIRADKNLEILDAWRKAYDVADTLVSNLDEDPNGVKPYMTHFWVDTVSTPEWASDSKPVKEIKFNGKTTRFYDLPEHIEYMAKFPI